MFFVDEEAFLHLSWYKSSDAAGRVESISLSHLLSEQNKKRKRQKTWANGLCVINNTCMVTTPKQTNPTKKLSPCWNHLGSFSFSFHMFKPNSNQYLSRKKSS